MPSHLSLHKYFRMPPSFPCIFARVCATLFAGVFAANTAHAQAGQSNCTLNEALTQVPSAQRAQVSMQFEACADKDWAAQKHFLFGEGFGFDFCYCNVRVLDASSSSECDHPATTSALSATVDNNFNLHYYFGATLQYLPERTEENKDACFVAHCLDGKEPSGFNMNGETECATPSTAVTVRAIAMPAEGGSAAIMGATTASVILNTTATIVATPAEGWYVDRWEGDGGACDGQTGRLEGFRGVDTDEKSCSLPASAGLTVTAHFALARVTVRAIAMPAEGGSAAIMGATTASVISNTTATIVATPAEGWYVDRWEGDGGACAGQVGGFGSSGAADTDEKSCSLAASAGLRVTVRFASALCVFSELPSGLQTELVSLQIDACNAKGWGAQKHIFGGAEVCHCNINAWDGRSGDPARQSCLDGSLPPHRTSGFSSLGETNSNTVAPFYFGATLQYLPERTEENKDDCFVARCSGLTEPSGFNTNGETECLAASGAICGGLTPAKNFDGVACVEGCATGATLNSATNTCECGTGNPNDCLTPSEAVCAELTPPKFFDGSDCVDFATCAGLLTLNRQHNGCECRAPNVGTASDCRAPNPIVCAAPAVRHPTANVCQCNAPNVGTGADCKAPSAEVCAALSPGRFFDGSGCVDFAECAGLLVLNPARNGCECRAPNVGTASDCRAPNPIVCAAPAVRHPTANVCQCNAPNVGTGADCKAPSAEVCGGLSPGRFFDGSGCVDFAECAMAATLNAAANTCECNSPNEGTAQDCKAPSAEVCGDLTPAKRFDGTACVDAPEDINLRLRIFLEGPLR